MDIKYMNEALKEAEKGYKKGEVPIGAVVVYKSKIIGRGYNQKEKTQNPSKHAEMIAIEQASRKLKSWRLSDCDLYVTVEPCLMCSGLIIQSRIKKLIYGAPNEKYGSIESINEVLNNPKNNHIVEVKSGILKEESAKLLKSFFKDQR